MLPLSSIGFALLMLLCLWLGVALHRDRIRLRNDPVAQPYLKSIAFITAAFYVMAGGFAALVIYSWPAP